MVCSLAELSSQSKTGESSSRELPPYSEHSARGVAPRSMLGGLSVNLLTFPVGHKAKYVRKVTIDLRPPHPHEIREYASIPPGEYVVWASENIAVGFWHEGPDSPGEPATIHYHDIIVNGQLGAIGMNGRHETRQLSVQERKYVKENHPANRM